MSVALRTRAPSTIPLASLKRFTAVEYNRLTESGVFTTEDRFELLDGWLVKKMPNNPPHAGSLGCLEAMLLTLLAAPWVFRTQRPISLSGDNVPEPDLVVVKGPHRKFLTRHPDASEIALLVEVSHSTLDQDRGIKKTMYARDRIREYWIVNLIDRCIEVYTEPKSGRSPDYRRMTSFGPGSSVPLGIDGKQVGAISVSELLP